MIEALRDPGLRVVGLKQTLRALQQDRVKSVYLASDVEDHVRRKIAAACAEQGVGIQPAGMSQRDLGTLCRIEVGAAVVAVLKARQ